MPFPRYGRDFHGSAPLFIGETHADTRTIVLLAWKLAWIHREVDAVFVEHYPSATGPSSASIAQIRREMQTNGMMGGSWLRDRPSLPAEIGQLKYHCDQYGVRLRGWDIAYKSNFQRAMPGWNASVVRKLFVDLASQVPRAPRRYIILGGGAHGDIMKANAVLFPDLPLFKRQGSEFVEVARLR